MSGMSALFETVGSLKLEKAAEFVHTVTEDAPCYKRRSKTGGRSGGGVGNTVCVKTKAGEMELELGREGMPTMIPLTPQAMEAFPACFELANFFIRNPRFQVNNKPTGSVCRHLRGMGALVTKRSDLSSRNPSFVVRYRGHSNVDDRKDRAWGGITTSTFMTTALKDISNNGGPNSSEHDLNVWRHALFASSTGSPLVFPCHIRERDTSASMILPFFVDNNALVAALPHRWARKKKSFAGAIGVPSEWPFNGKAIVFTTAILFSANLNYKRLSKLAVKIIEEVSPFFTGINVEALRDCITSQQTAVIIPNELPPPGAPFPAGRLATFGKNTVAMYTPRPDEPVTRLPLFRDSEMTAVGDFTDAMEAAIQQMCQAEDLAQAQAQAPVPAPGPPSSLFRVCDPDEVISESQLSVAKASLKRKRAERVGVFCVE